MATGTGPVRSTPAELDDELQALVDVELGNPRRRAMAGHQARYDSDALYSIAELLRNPRWDSELLELICDVIRDTGRPVGGPPLAVIAS